MDLLTWNISEMQLSVRRVSSWLKLAWAVQGMSWEWQQQQADLYKSRDEMYLAVH